MESHLPAPPPADKRKKPSAPSPRQQELSLRTLIARVAIADLHADALRSLESHWNSDVTNIRGGNVMAETRAMIAPRRAASGRNGDWDSLIDSQTARSVQSAFAAAYGTSSRVSSASSSPRVKRSTTASSSSCARSTRCGSSHAAVLPAVHVPPAVVLSPGKKSKKRRPVSVVQTYSHETDADGVKRVEVLEERLMYLRTASDFEITTPHHVCPACSAPITCPRQVSHCQRVL